MQNEFINIAAHELRTPTQAILGFSELLQMENLDDLKAARDAIFRNANRLHKLTDDILDVTRIEGQRLKLEKEKFDMNQKIDHVIEDTKRVMLNGRRTKIIFERTEKEISVYADKVRIFQVISNLLDNALKFTKNGSITIKAEKIEGNAVVTVTDDGKGIDPEIIPKLFTKFASKSESGTGLGLYICKNIIEAHGGKIWAKNNENAKGSTFTFSLPPAVQEGSG
jgi:signal transduction histidine kinase